MKRHASQSDGLGYMNMEVPDMEGWLQLEFEWHDVMTPLIISLCLFCIIIAKLAFHSTERLVSKFPESALLVVLGLIVGAILDHFWFHEVYLHPDLFFLYLLPPIALEAGYSLPNRPFFQNIGTIGLYAIVGTLWNIFSIGVVLHLLSPFYSVSVPFIDLLLFATLISAVDPVAVLSVFEEINVNKLLHICVFGESLLNDAVVIVLYHAVGAMARIGPENLEKENFLKASVSFFLVTFGGLTIGVIWAAITGLTTRFSDKVQVVQPMICLLFPYLAYLISESVHMSGILAIAMCGLMMKRFVKGNLSESSLVTTTSFMKTLSSSCEAIIFVFLGLSTVSKKHDWNIIFIVVTLIACLLCRFFGTFVLTFIANRRRVEKIRLVDQFIMAYGGLRGAICYGLVMTLDKDVVLAKEMFVSTTIVVIIFTVFIQGTTIKPLVKLLDVKTEEEREMTLAEKHFSDAQDDILAGIEAIIGLSGPNMMRRRVSLFSSNYVQPCMMRIPASRGQRLLSRTFGRSMSEMGSQMGSVLTIDRKE